MGEQKRPEWMISIASTVDTDDYLLGRKIDKTFELSQKEKAQRALEARRELVAKDKIRLSDDPILDLERRRAELKMQLIQNPVMMKQFRDRLLREARGTTKESVGKTTDYEGKSNSDSRSSGDRQNNVREDEVKSSKQCEPQHDEPRRTGNHESHDGVSGKHSHQYDSEDSRHRRSREDRRGHSGSRGLESKHHRSRHRDSHAESERWNTSRDRHSDSRREDKSSRRSRSPSSRHRHRHEYRDTNRSPKRQ